MEAMQISLYLSLTVIFTINVVNADLRFNSNLQKTQIIQSENGDFVLQKGPETQVTGIIAEVEYEIAVNRSGWNYVYAWTNGSYPDEQQAYLGGYLEVRSDPLINMHYKNTMAGQCTNGSTPNCKRLQSFLVANLKFMKAQILSKRNTDPFWHQVELILWQVMGMDDAYHHRPMRSPSQLLPSKLDLDPFGMFFWQVAAGDMEELSDALKTPSERAAEHNPYRVKPFGHCSGLVKRLPNFGDVLVAQDTWNGYNSMLRHMKLYEFNFRKTASRNSAPIPGGHQSFSSYPGLLQSGDDFYVMDSKIVTFETTNGFYNNSLYDIIRKSGGKIVFEFIRTQVANRLANSVADWQKYFANFNSGTYNNQWVIVDYKNVVKGHPFSSSGVLGVSEQIPGLVVSKDMTQHLHSTTYWPSYNTPYFKEIYSRSDFASMLKKYGNFFDYNRTARANIFRRDHSKVIDVKTMIRLMRYNNFKKDPLSRCPCKPPYTGEYAIAARSDLNDPKGTYPFSALGHRNHGATDMKLAVPALLNDLGFVGISGPTFDQQPPFRWSTSGLKSPHFGQPDLWQFGPILTPWRRIRTGDTNAKSFVVIPQF